jgi:acetylornithine aminotransferase
MNEKYLLPVYTRVGPVFVKGKGSFLWDARGRKYLDLFPGWGVGILGHSHPAVVAALREQAARLVFLPNNLHHPWQGRLAARIVSHSFDGLVFFANSGAEAVEGALKFTRLYGQGCRHEVITMKNSFHGRTFGAVSSTGQKKYKVPFKPLLPGFREARFNDFDDVRKKITKKTVAVMLELIQGEGGVNVAGKEYVKQLRAYCTRHDILFIVDEVQTGMGRTGRMFCYQHYGITPDIMLLAKGLGAGMPVSCMVVRRKIASLMRPGHHASTFGGNPLAARVSWEVFRAIQKEKLLAHAKKMSTYLFKRLSGLKSRYSLIKEVRGKGLMAGVELNIKAAPVVADTLKKRLIVNATHDTVIRIMPALTVSIAELDKGLAILEEILARHNKRHGGCS